LAACCVLAATLWAWSAQAQFTYTNGGTLNANMTYDGLVVDSALNPFSVGSPATSGNYNNYIGSGTGNSGQLSVISGTLTFYNQDFKIAASGGVGVLLVTGPSTTLNINNDGMWGAGVDNSGAATGTLIISNNAVLNWDLDGSVEQHFVVGSTTGDTGRINIYSGTFNLYLDPAANVTDTCAGWQNGWNNPAFYATTDETPPVSDVGTATINLYGGTLNNQLPLPFVLGGGFTNVTTTPGPNFSISTCVMNILNGSFVMPKVFAADPNYTNASSFYVGPNSYVNFIPDGSGSLSLTNWTASNYEALVTNG
jgi:hypothetical protein